MMDKLSVSVAETPQNKDVTIMTVRGFMDTNTSSIFEKSFLALLNDNRFKLVVDLKDVDYISSSGWGLFVSEIKRIRKGKGDLILAGMNPEVREVFDLLGFQVILKFYPDVETAVKKGFGTKT